MKRTIKLGLIFGLIGIAVHLLINFGPLLLGIVLNSTQLKSLSNISLSFNMIRIVIYFVIGFVVGLIINLLKK